MKNKKKRLISAFIGSALLASQLAIPAVTSSAAGKLVAFPGAEGAGKYATGGRGGTVYHVTNLNDSGTGSFRDAVSGSNRIVVFDVGGTIELKSDVVCKSNVTIAGQTAPGGQGITLKNYKFGMGGDNIIVRFISSRPGERGEGAGDYDAWGGGYGSNSVIDHCSIGWANDEQFGLYSTNMNQTVQYTIVGPSNCVSYHSKGAHGFGVMFGKGQNSWHHNLICHNLSRNFRGKVEKNQSMDFVNNVMYDWGSQTAYGTLGHLNFVNNYYKAGPSTKGVHRYISISSGSNYETFRFYLTGNTMRNPDDSVYSETMDANNWSGGIDYGNAGLVESDYRVDTPFAVKAADGTDASVMASLESPEAAYQNVLAHVGAAVNAQSRTKIDAQVVEETRTGTGSLTGGRVFSTVTDADVKSAIDKYGIQYCDYKPYYPTAVSSTIVDSDKDGMPDAWELERGLNPNSAADANGDYLGQGYTNIEYYINDLTVDAFPKGVVTVSPKLADLGEDYNKLIADADAIKLSPTSITAASDLSLPTAGAINGSKIVWSSDSSNIVISNNKITKVTRPSDSNKKVTLTAAMSLGEYTLNRSFTVTVLSTTSAWKASSADNGKAAGTKLMNGLYTVSDITAADVSAGIKINNTAFTGYVTGADSGKWENGAATGTALKYTASENGFLTAYITSLGANKTAYIREENSDNLASVHGENGSERMLTLPVEAGKSYYIFVASSKGRFAGVTFSAAMPKIMWDASVSVTQGTWLADNLYPNEDMTYTASANTIDGVSFAGSIKGTTNPADNGASGAALTYTPQHGGTLTVYFKLGAGKGFKVNTADGTVINSTTNETTASVYTSLSANLEGGKTYYIYGEGTKAEIFGVRYAPSAYSADVPTTAPTTAPTAAPSTAPTAVPTAKPTTAPTSAPTTAPVSYSWAMSDAYTNATAGTELMKGFTMLFTNTSGNADYLSSADNGKFADGVASGTAFRFVAPLDGKLSVGFKDLGGTDGTDKAKKSVYIVEENGSQDSPLAVVTSDGTNKLSGTVSAEVRKGTTYYIYGAGTKARFVSAKFVQMDLPPIQTVAPTVEPTTAPTVEPTTAPSGELPASEAVFSMNNTELDKLASGTVEIFGSAPDDAKSVYAALYGADGKLLSVKLISGKGGEFSGAVETDDGASTLKLFIWSDLIPKTLAAVLNR